MTKTKPVLQVIIASTRPGRVGGAIATWFFDLATDHGGFDVELVDLLEVNLPIFDEPEQPITEHYLHEHTKRWSSIVKRADALVFVVPEYNHSINAAIKNAIDYLHVEWRYKPYGLVPYGGAARGLRAAAVLKPIFAALRATWCGDVAISLPLTPVENGVFQGNDELVRSAQRLLNELAVFAPMLRTLRDERS